VFEIGQYCSVVFRLQLRVAKESDAVPFTGIRRSYNTVKRDLAKLHSGFIHALIRPMPCGVI